MSFTIDGLEQASKQPTDGRAVVYKLAGGDLFPVVNPPVAEDGSFPYEGHEAAKIVREALNALATVDRARRAALADETLSDVGREQKVEALRQSSRLAGEMARAELERLERNTEAANAAVYSPPSLDPQDLAGALIDQEIRHYARSLRGDDATKYATGVLPTDTRHLAAIARSPVPMHMLSEHARNLWVEHVSKTEPRAAQVARTKTAVDWAKAVLPHVISKL